MKRFLALALGIVVIVGVVAAWAPFPAIANVKDPSRCGGLGACRIEEGEPPSCPPCYYFEYCLPKCGCRPIPGCELLSSKSLASRPRVAGYGGGIADQR